MISNRWAWWILTLIVAFNILLFIFGLFYPGLRDTLMLHSPSHPTAPILTALLNWRAMASYSFVHSGPAHLLFNMLFLLAMGRFFIIRRGLNTFLISFLTGVIAGGMGFLLAIGFIPSVSGNSLCGASAGVVGMCGTALLCNPSRNYKILISVIVLTSFLGNLTIPAFATHLFGFGAGIITEILLKSNIRKNSDSISTDI